LLVVDVRSRGETSHGRIPIHRLVPGIADHECVARHTGAAGLVKPKFQGAPAALHTEGISVVQFRHHCAAFSLGDHECRDGRVLYSPNRRQEPWIGATCIRDVVVNERDGSASIISMPRFRRESAGATDDEQHLPGVGQGVCSTTIQVASGRQDQSSYCIRGGQENLPV